MRSGATPCLARYARTASARACESFRFVAEEPVLFVYPAISIRMSGFPISDCATMSSTVKDSDLRADLPTSNVTPRRITGVRSGVNRIGQPAASTLVPAAVPGHLSLVSSTPSPSESLKRWQPTLSTSSPGGVLGHLSMPSGTPSLSESRGQPAEATVEPVRHAVAVRVRGAAFRVHLRAGRRVGTLVDAVVHAVGVRVGGAPCGVHGHASGGAGALVQAVGHAVAVRIEGAAACVDDGGRGRAGAGVALVGDAVVVQIRSRSATRQERQAERADDVASPVSAGEPGAGRIQGAHFKAQRDPVPQEHAVADRAVRGVVGEPVRRRLLEVEPRVAAEEIEDIVGAPEIQDETRATEGERGRRAACLRARALVPAVELRAEEVAEEITEAGAAAELVVEVEGLVVARERSERPELKRVGALLSAEAGDPARECQSHGDERPHGATPPSRAWPYGNNSAPG